MFGSHSPFLQKGQWELGVSYRGFVSDKHYQGSEPFPELDPFGPRNRQHQISIRVATAVTDRINLSASIPLHFNDFQLNRVPPGSDAQNPIKDSTSSNGLGDMSLKAKYWAFDTLENTGQNLALGISLKLPTGNEGATDDIYGREVPVDWSVQLGDGGWGFTPSLEGFVNVERFTFFGSAFYLVSPQNTSDTPAFFPTLFNRPGAPENSIADQYALQGGVAFRTPPDWPVPTLAYRLEGVPVDDLIGDSDGFRRPGRIGFVEPGFTYSIGPHNFSFSIPIRQYVDIKDSPYSLRVEDATVPDLMFLLSYSTRF